MSGRRLRSFREGDLAEGFGLELLRRIALVAPVPRQEDVGVDGVCNVLRREGDSVFPEETFAVQVKSASKRVLDLTSDDRAWLRSFDLPLFFLSVDLKGAQAELYSLVNLFAPGADVAPTLSLDRPAKFLTIETQPWLLARRVGTVEGVYVGPPVLSFSFPEIEKPDVRDLFASLIRAHARISADVIQARRSGVAIGVRWEEGGEPRVGSLTLDSYDGLSDGDRSERYQAYRSIGAPLLKIETCIMAEDPDPELHAAIQVLRDRAERVGVRLPGFR